MIKSLFDESEEKLPVNIEETNQPEAQTEPIILPEEVLFEKPAFNDREISISHDVETIEEPATQSAISNSSEPIFAVKTPEKGRPMPFQMPAKPESIAETARKSGLAMSAAIALFGSVVFLLVIGWFADLLLGTSPWGVIGGIILGSVIGFFQFFRMTSQILKNKD
ncbi:hypothetical protein BH24ACI2_BH24ACI2_11280 [soil metagenome]|jgi:hypothetical protein|nr:AtpZ/AtpI family protein [Acidobacteriota bacterium]